MRDKDQKSLELLYEAVKTVFWDIDEQGLPTEDGNYKLSDGEYIKVFDGNAHFYKRVDPLSEQYLGTGKSNVRHSLRGPAAIYAAETGLAPMYYINDQRYSKEEWENSPEVKAYRFKKALKKQDTPEEQDVQDVMADMFA